MKFDLDDLNPPVWFEMPGDSGGKLAVRVCAGEDLERIRKKTVKKRSEYRRGQRFEFTETDEAKENELIWDHCIVDWSGLLDKNDKKIKCSTENKILLMRKSAFFSGFLAKCLETLSQDMAGHIESAEKN